MLWNGCSHSGLFFEINTHCYYSMEYWRNWWHTKSAAAVHHSSISIIIFFNLRGTEFQKHRNDQKFVNLWKLRKLRKLRICWTKQKNLTCHRSVPDFGKARLFPWTIRQISSSGIKYSQKLLENICLKLYSYDLNTRHSICGLLLVHNLNVSRVK